MPFTKLDEGILQSSVMAESPSTFKVWIGLLASCGPDGIARVSSIFLATACHLRQDGVDHALEILSAPDPRSRSEAEEGRRIRKVDGGYFVINYEKYRVFSYSEKPEAIRKREYRKRTKEEEDAFNAWWAKYPRKISKQDAVAAYSAALKAKVKPEDLLQAVSGYIHELRRLGTEEKYIMYPATFLRADRWKDYLDRPAPRDVGQPTTPPTTREKEIARQVGEFVKKLWDEARPLLDEARARGVKAFNEAYQKTELEIARRSGEFSRQLHAEVKS